jgi:phosphoribosyl 1,2-cyclic phosphodiesterase
MADCGADWLRRLSEIARSAIVLTHAHMDHAGGLRNGAPCPVYATAKTLDLLRRFPIDDRRRLLLRKEAVIGGVRFEPFAVDHSIRAPAVGLKNSAEGKSFFYVPDVARLRTAKRALHNADFYVGDGATLKRSMVRQKKRVSVGHASIVDQLGWCAKADVRRVIFTHCGSGIVRENPHRLRVILRQLGADCGIDAHVASDGDELVLEGMPPRSRSRRPARHA